MYREEKSRYSSICLHDLLKKEVREGEVSITEVYEKLSREYTKV